MSAIKKYNIEEFESEAIDIDEYSKEYREWLDNSELLHTETHKSGTTSSATFDSDTWIMLKDLHQKFYVFDFKSFDFVIKQGVVSNDDILLIKCWITSKLMDEFDVIRLRKTFMLIKQIIEVTKNFDKEFIYKKEGNELLSIMDTKANHPFISNVKDYLYYLDDLGCADENILDAITILDDIEVIIESNSKRIPYNKDILAFKYYLDRFFKEQQVEALKGFYIPLLLWWKITMVIPMRPSEFAYKLKRDCIEEKDGVFYLKIDRVKIKDKSNKAGRIPVLSKIKITKDIYNLIQEYIDMTSFDDESKTLISYNAMKFFEQKSSKLNLPVKVLWNGIMKPDTTCFNRDSLKRLLDSFYDVVIEGIYEDTTIDQRLTSGDTRHLAFCSLMMQGLNPIEIAMLGGHRHLRSQDSYTGHVEFFIDSEIIDFAGSKNIEQSISDRNLVKLIFSKPDVCPRFIADCDPTEEGIGYCTLDIETAETLCEDVETCMFCSKWWCEPTSDNYVKAKNFLKNNILSELKQTILKEEQFLLQLLSEAKTININGLLDLDKEYEEQVSIARLKLKSSVDKMISLKQSLLTYNTEIDTIGDGNNG